MTIFKYISDKKAILIVFTLIMLFVDAVFYLDPKTSISESNIIYVNLFAALILLFYLLSNYMKINSMLKKITNQEENIFHNLSERMDNEHIQYFNVLKDVYEKIEIEKTLLKHEKKEHSEFIEKWIHEIKTPISVINLIIEKEKSIPETLRNSLNEELIKITDNVERVLYYSKLDSFNQDYFIEKINVFRVIKNVIKSTSQFFIRKRISIDINDKSFFANTDKKWLQFIIYQIITNSLKYTPEGGRIVIDHRETNTSDILSITDTGCGIRPEDTGRIFSKGFTGYNGRQNSNATGLGLYISSKLAEKLNLTLSVKSELNRYTTINIIFPKEHDYFKVTEM